MANPENFEQFKQLIQKMKPGAKLLHSWRLEGGVSAQVTALEVQMPGGAIQKMVLRHHSIEGMESFPTIIDDEYRVLKLLHTAGIAVPEPYSMDASCEILPVPYLVLEFIEGQPDFSPDDLPDAIRQFTTYLTRLHCLDITGWDLSFLPTEDALYTEKLKTRPECLDDSLQEGQIRDALAAIVPLHPVNSTVFLHSDFWPGNMMWRDGHLVAVIDWEEAKLGDPIYELARSRMEILWAYGLEAMHQFTQTYQALMPALDYRYLPHWDLYAALGPAHKLITWISDPVQEKRMREQHRLFVAQALANLPG